MAVPRESFEMFMDGLDAVWDTSDILLKRISTTDVEGLVNDLKNSPRQWKAIENSALKLEDAIRVYDSRASVSRPLDVSATLQSIFGTAEITYGAHRPDDILYRANLACFLKDVLGLLMKDINDLEFDNYLEIFSTALFSEVVRTDNEGEVPGYTTSFKATFELALEFRTQAYIGMLLESVEEDSPFDFYGALPQMFADGAMPKGWNIPGLGTHELNNIQLKAVRGRFQRLANAVKNYQTDDPELQKLRTQFPLIKLANQIFDWGKQRDKELVNRIEDVAGGIGQIQAAIDQEVARLGSVAEYDEDTIRVASAVPAPAASSKDNKKAKKEEIYGMLKANISSRSRPESRIDAATPASASRPPRDPASELPLTVDNQDAMTDFGHYEDQDYGMGNDQDALQQNGEGQNEFDAIDPGIARQQAMELALGARDSEKENLRPSKIRTKRSYMDSQTQGRSLTFDDSSQQAYPDKGKQRAIDPALEDEDHGDEDEGHFETQASPPAKKRKVIQRTARPQAKPQPYHIQPTQDFPSSPARSTPRHSLDLHRSQAYSQVNTEAKERIRSIAKHNPIGGKRRVPYSEEEIETFIELVARLGTSWAKIKKTDQEEGDVLHLRDQVALKDKARNMTMDYLKAGRLLPPNFEKVALKKVEVDKLHSMGIPWPPNEPLGSADMIEGNEGFEDVYDDEGE